ncbi:MAG TPA: flavodoxin domain-containing protein [Acidimicrobiales bacterium]
MKALVVYESMFGNTHLVADRIAAGMRPRMEVEVVSVHDATAERVAAVDLVVVGAPTHAHGLPSSQSRKGAVEMAAKPDSGLTLDPGHAGEGLRDWFHDLHPGRGLLAAAFDTRIDVSPLLSGRASKAIARRLEQHGFALVTDPESFLVDKQSHLLEGEADRAERWGASLYVGVHA